MSEFGETLMIIQTNVSIFQLWNSVMKSTQIFFFFFFLLVWVAFPAPGDSFRSRDWTQATCITGRFFTTEPQGKPQKVHRFI